MPRERTLSPGFFANHLLASCPPLTRLLFQGIWTLADFDGCFRWDPEGLAMKLLPRDQFDSVEAMDLLERLGFIKAYEANSTKFGFIVNWHKYQDPHPGERPVFPKPFDDSTFHVRVKAPKYRSSIDLGFGRLDIQAGISQFQQVVSMLQASCEKVASNAFPSLPSLPSSPSLPTKETTTTAAPPAPLLPEVVNGKPKRPTKASKKFEIAALMFTEDQEVAFQKVWDAWPKEGWNFSTKSTSPRRLNRALAMERFLAILQNCRHQIDGMPLQAVHLAESAIEFVNQRKRENPGGVPNVPCIANFFSSEEVSKKPWQSALLAHFGE